MNAATAFRRCGPTWCCAGLGIIVALWAGEASAVGRSRIAHSKPGAQNDVPRALKGVSVAEQLGRALDLSLAFVDQQGKSVVLRDYFKSGKPVLLTLNYYRCPMLCTLQLNVLTETLRRLEWKIGEKFRMLTVSIDPKETPDLARAKRDAYLARLGRGEVDWTFVVGQQAAITKLAQDVGFQYTYDAKSKQYAHPAVVFFISPEGKVARYLYGLEYPAQEVKFALIEASAGRVGSPLEKLILSCYQYDASVGRYGPFARGIMRLAGVLTLVGLGTMLLVLRRRNRRSRTERSDAPVDAPRA